MPQALLLALVIYACFFSHLDALGLVGPDEPRYAEVAREMAQSGDWVTPRLYGKPWFEKPILYYWGAALAYCLFGVNEFAARLPSALAALLAALALAWAAWKAWGTEARTTLYAALLIFLTCAAGIGFARAAAPDMLFSATLAAAMAVAVSIVEAGAGAPASGGATTATGPRRTSRVALLLLGTFLGAATLAKGPAAIVLAGGSATLWALVTRRWREALRLAHPLALAAFFVTALPWYALCAHRNPGFLRVFFLEHNFARYLTPVFRHEQPFWFYAPVLLVALLPWTALLVAVVRDGIQLWREKRLAASPSWFLACWAIFPLLFFSFSKSKLPGYLLPAIPPLVLLMAHSLSRLEKKSTPAARWYVVAVGLTLTTLGIGTVLVWPRILKSLLPGTEIFATTIRHFPPGLMESMVLAILGGIVIAGLGFQRRARAALLLAALCVTCVMGLATTRTLPWMDDLLSARAAARALKAQPGALQNAYAFRLHRAGHFGLNFYLQHELPEWRPETPRPTWVFTNSVGAAELERRSLRVSFVDRTSPKALLVIVSDRPAAAAHAEH